MQRFVQRSILLKRGTKRTFKRSTYQRGPRYTRFRRNIRTTQNRTVSPYILFGGLLLSAGTSFILLQQKKRTFALTAPAKVDYEAVKKAIISVLDNENYEDGSYGPVLVRLAWHASGTYHKGDNTGGSNGATMRFHPESGHGANAGLDIARNLLEPIKKQFPGISYADLWTLAGATAIEHMGGPKIPWVPGRVDHTDEKKCPPDGRLPDASKGAQHIRDVFFIVWDLMIKRLLRLLVLMFLEECIRLEVDLMVLGLVLLRRSLMIFSYN